MEPGTIAVPHGCSKGIYVVVKTANDQEVWFDKFIPAAMRRHPTENGISHERVRPATFAARYDVLHVPEPDGA
jgi:hypothetical protein